MNGELFMGALFPRDRHQDSGLPGSHAKGSIVWLMMDERTLEIKQSFQYSVALRFRDDLRGSAVSETIDNRMLVLWGRSCLDLVPAILILIQELLRLDTLHELLSAEARFYPSLEGSGATSLSTITIGFHATHMA